MPVRTCLGAFERGAAGLADLLTLRFVGAVNGGTNSREDVTRVCSLEKTDRASR
jgi:hypothetical protein